MALYKIPVLAILIICLGLPLWLMLRPTEAQRQFAKGFSRSNSPFGPRIADYIRAIPTIIIRLWGALSAIAEVFVMLAVIYLVD